MDYVICQNSFHVKTVQSFFLFERTKKFGVRMKVSIDNWRGFLFLGFGGNCRALLTCLFFIPEQK